MASCYILDSVILFCHWFPINFSWFLLSSVTIFLLGESFKKIIYGLSSVILGWALTHSLFRPRFQQQQLTPPPNLLNGFIHLRDSSAFLFCIKSWTRQFLPSSSWSFISLLRNLLRWLPKNLFLGNWALVMRRCLLAFGSNAPFRWRLNLPFLLKGFIPVIVAFIRITLVEYLAEICLCLSQLCPNYLWHIYAWWRSLMTHDFLSMRETFTVLGSRRKISSVSWRCLSLRDLTVELFEVFPKMMISGGSFTYFSLWI